MNEFFKYGKIAYEAYCKSRNWKSIRGEPLPQFEAQSSEIIQAWVEAGNAVARDIQLTIGQG